MGRGLLVFKGDKDHKKKSKSKTKHNDDLIPSSSSSSNTKITTKESTHQKNIEAVITTTSKISKTPQSSEAEVSQVATRAPSIQKGSGKLTSSGTVLNGIYTQFDQEVAVGDAMIIIHPKTKEQEMRVITMCLSDVSCAISSPFSIDISEYIDFSYINAPSSFNDRKTEEERKKEKLKKDQAQLEKIAFGIYAGGGATTTDNGSSGNNNNTLSFSGKTKELVYRLPTETGSYRIVREQVDSDTTRVDLLNLRMKKKSDKYC